MSIGSIGTRRRAGSWRSRTRRAAGDDNSAHSDSRGRSIIDELDDTLTAHRTELLNTLERLRGHLAALDHKIGVYTAVLETEKELV